MKFSRIVAEYCFPSGEFVGRVYYMSWLGEAIGYRELLLPDILHGRPLSTGQYQLYRLASGHLTKIGTVKEEAIEWQNTIFKDMV